MKVQKNVAILLSLVVCCLLLFFLWWHWRLGVSRYFDVDEFAHLSWAYQMLSGRKPYIDFLLFIPPGFYLFLMPLFTLGGGVAPILAGRVMAFIVFVLLVGVTMLLFWLMRRSWVAIVAGLFLAFLPLPFDKFLEIRPDTLATLFVTVGMVFQILALNGFTLPSGKVRPYLITAGACYGLSLLTLPKTLPQVAVAVVLLLVVDIGTKFGVWRRDRKAKNSTLAFIIGLGLPLALFGLWAVTFGNIDQVIYSLLKLPVEANKISETFVMMPDLFFYPNTIFYGEPGWSKGLLVNHTIWVVAILVGAYRLVAPFSARGRENVWAEFLIAATFFVHVIFYVMIVPLKHTQYLIPIAVFVAFYAADAVDMLWRSAQESSKNIANFLPIGIFLALFLLVSIWLWQVFVVVNTPKLAWTNVDTIQQLNTLYKTIPTSEYVLDLTGATLYYKHPYTVCCLPFGQFAPYLTRPLQPLAKALEETGTKYIYQGGLNRVSTLLPQDQQYISRRYLPHPAIAGLLVRKK